MAFGQSTIGGIGGAVQDIFASQAQASGLRLRSRGNLAEAELYDESGRLAKLNEEYTKQSTEIQNVQAERNILQTIGAQQAEVGAAGLASSGSALDLLRSSAQQGALTHQIITQQGAITEAGYEEQARAYSIMAGAARDAATTQDEMADKTETAGWIGAGFKAAASIASLFG